ncbi:spermidine synthase [Citricoccus zhacaiensis]|uniref:Spermidine synthase n=1 Tax=Citricoccus zhacaiensis TaxID=489142 RepID=A0ABQ2LY76_9MICC|nr:fused MFS/spermidine synthase [Citricoccus zhacaiensis]GGO44746.1 spermidine synthase [Citricoccus zhacaiensis]
MADPDAFQPTRRSLQLSVSGEQVRILPDEHDDGWVLEIGGAVQSHVDLHDPTRIRYEYLRRVANVLDAGWPGDRPLRILHLGAGALTLPRYVQLARPGSVQTVVDLDRELPTLVCSVLPLPEGTDLTVVIGDARAELARLEGQEFDAIILDIYTAVDAAVHLTGSAFYGELLGHLTESGVLLVNIGDDTGLRFLARQAQALEVAAAGAGLTGAWTLADATMLDRLQAGNAVLAAGSALDGQDQAGLHTRLLAAGPHPAAVLVPEQTAALAARIG